MLLRSACLERRHKYDAPGNEKRSHGLVYVHGRNENVDAEGFSVYRERVIHDLHLQHVGCPTLGQCCSFQGLLCIRWLAFGPVDFRLLQTLRTPITVATPGCVRDAKARGTEPILQWATG